MKNSLTLTLMSVFLFACSAQKKIAQPAEQLFLTDSTIKHAHVGISVYNLSANKHLYQYQADKFFMPASNTKIVTSYAAMKFLGDSVPGIRYVENDTALFVIPTGDPTFLHEDYKKHPVLDFLIATKKKIYITDGNWKSTHFGSGWSWDYYPYYYGPERSAMPVYGNYVKFEKQKVGDQYVLTHVPAIFNNVTYIQNNTSNYRVQRDWKENKFTVITGKDGIVRQDMPFVTNGIETTIAVLKDLLGKEIYTIDINAIPSKDYKVVYSQHIDSLLKPLMLRSDNFFAEQTLIMVANELTGELNDHKGIEALRKTIYKNMPNNFRWVDGSGLSRGNHFSPNDFVAMLKDLVDLVGVERIKHIYPHGGVGTLKNYFKEIPDHFSAKTGTLTGVVALSGILETKKGTQLIVSLQVNHHRGETDHVRRKYEDFVMYLYNNF